MTDTATAAYLDRYRNAREKFVGEDGATYTVRPLKLSEIFKLRDILKDADPATFNMMSAVASICWKDETPILFPKNRKDLDWICDGVGFKGITPLTAAFNKVNADEDAATEPEADAA